ncbi:hypothetical protein Bca101_032914 [Brassica carinata]
MLAVRIVSTENVSPAPSPVKYITFLRLRPLRLKPKAGIAFGVIAAASIVCVGGYMLKKRRDNIRRSRYEYAATEFF